MRSNSAFLWAFATESRAGEWRNIYTAIHVADFGLAMFLHLIHADNGVHRDQGAFNTAEFTLQFLL